MGLLLFYNSRKNGIKPDQCKNQVEVI
jgi:hypothetical protein